MGSSGSSGKGDMGLVEALMNPVGYVVPSLRKFDPITSQAAPHFDKWIGTQSQQTLDTKATAKGWAEHYRSQGINPDGSKGPQAPPSAAQQDQVNKTRPSLVGGKDEQEQRQSARRAAPRPKAKVSLLDDDESTE